MSKKSRRAKAPRLSAAQKVQPVARAEIVTAPAHSEAKAEAGTSDLKQEYRYVFADLKRIGIIAVAMLAVLIVLAFVLV
ncbi:MAG: hypothetical protein GX601_05525 [Anaerolineales bacterium]|nr:hypothetical protein [Anaerolineales bacterium]